MENMLNRKMVESLIFKLKKLQKSWQEITQYINYELKTTYTIQDIITHHQDMTKQLNSEEISQIFNNFKTHETNYQIIAYHTGISTFSVKQQILTGFANNIAKVCLIVRKRQISSLQSNILSNNKIKQLVLKILKNNEFQKVKSQYSVLWNFISGYYPDSFYQTVSNEQYRAMYRELIILTQSMKVCTKDELLNQLGNGEGFEKEALKSFPDKGEMTRIQSMFELSQKINVENEMISLLSEDQESGNEEVIPIIERSKMEDQVENIQMIDEALEVRNPTVLRQRIITSFRLKRIESKLQEDPFSEDLQDEQIDKVISLGCLNLINRYDY